MDIQQIYAYKIYIAKLLYKSIAGVTVIRYKYCMMKLFVFAIKPTFFSERSSKKKHIVVDTWFQLTVK